MKNIKAFFCLMLMLVDLAACTTDENLLPAAGNGNAAAIRFTLGGSADKAASRATVAAEDNEKEVNSVLAVLFDTHKGFYKTVEARPQGDAYDILVEDDATYDIYFVANADADLRTKLENIADTTQAKYAYNALSSIMITQAPDANEFVMVSTTPKRVTTTITKTEDIGTVALTRLAARFDIVNKAEGTTVNKVTFKNRTVKGNLRIANYMPLNEEGLFNNKSYENLDLGGSAEMPGVYKQQIYSYRNFSMHPDSIPVLTIEYTETDADGKSVVREHDVKFIDPKAPAGTPLAISSNNLYTITLTKAYKLEFTLSVDDWNEAETFNATELEVLLNPSKQQELNESLLIYDLFADNYVATIDASSKTATFFDRLIDGKDFPSSAIFTFTNLANQGLLANDAFVTVDGQKYRVPTLGEIQLLMPMDERYVKDNTNPEPMWTKPTFGGARYTTEKFTETVYLKNDANNLAMVTEDMSDESIAFSGESQILLGQESKMLYIDNATNYYCDGTPENCTVYKRYSCYATRFKGSKQYSAYKWEPGLQDENGVYYVSIKIKALPEETDLTVYDIADNYAFWRDGFIEIKMPYTGYGYTAQGQNLRNNPFAWYIWAANKFAGQTTNSIFAGANYNSLYIDKTSPASGRALRLVKVKDAAE